MSSSLYVMQHIKKMRGGSQAHLLRISDGGFYVTKLAGNPQHTRVLANEMLASRLGQWLGLPMPSVAAIELSDWLIEHTQDLCFEVVGARIKCKICHEPFTDYEDIVPDHIRSKGMGSARRDDHPDNIQAAHGICNLEKGSKTQVSRH